MLQYEPRRTTEPIILSVDRNDYRVDLSLLVPETLVYFRGHFPRFPVLPGIVQLHWASTYGQRYFNVGEIANFQVKFKSIIRPGELIRLGLSLFSEANRLAFEYLGDQDVRSSGSIRYEVG